MARAAGKTCQYKGRYKKARALRSFLERYGDDLPSDVIQKATTGENLSRWSIVCDDRGELVSVMRWEPSDWYLCSLKNAATRPDRRGEGFGKDMYKQAAEDALNNGCLVLAADVTHDNTPSRKILEKLGFAIVNRFCWGKGKKPSDILHYVKVPPEGTRCTRNP